MRGHPGLPEYADAHTRVLRGRHMTLNHLYEINGDHATGRATTVVSIETKRGFKIMGQGAYEDELVKADGEWKIRHRRVVNDYLVSDPAVTVSLVDPDVAALVQSLIDTANKQSRPPHRHRAKNRLIAAARNCGSVCPRGAYDANCRLRALVPCCQRVD